MAGGIMADLSMRLSANTAELKKGLNQAKDHLKDFQKGTKEATSNVKDAFRDIAGAASPAINSMTGGFSSIIGMVKSSITAFRAMIPAMSGIKAAFISTGIGAIIIAITAAIAGLISWMKRTDEGSDAMRKAFDVVKAVINTVLDKLAKLGGAIVKLFKGDFKGAWEDTKDAMTGWGDAIQSNIEKAGKLNDLQDELEDRQEVYAKKRAELEVQISDLQLKARDKETYNAQQRLAYNEQLKKKIKELYDLDFALKNNELAIVKQEAATNVSNQEIRQKVNEKEAELIKLRADYNSNLKETIKLNNTLLDDAREEVELEELKTLKANNGPINKIGKIQNISFKSPVDSTTLVQMKEYKSTISEVVDKLIEMGDATTMAAVKMSNTLSSAFMSGADSFKEYAKVVKSSLKEAIGAFIAEGVAALVGGALKRAALTPGGLLLAAPLAALAGGIAKTAFNSIIPKFETGGLYGMGGLALVGEGGPELVNLPAGSRVYNNRQSSNMMGAGQVEFRIEGTTLVGVLNNIQRSNNSFR